jgi:hypothetical protein
VVRVCRGVEAGGIPTPHAPGWWRWDTFRQRGSVAVMRVRVSGAWCRPARSDSQVSASCRASHVENISLHSVYDTTKCTRDGDMLTAGGAVGGKAMLPRNGVAWPLRMCESRPASRVESRLIRFAGPRGHWWRDGTGPVRVCVETRSIL